MRIVVDLQGAQTESRYRGIGRNNIAMTQALLRNRGEHKVIVALNGLFPDTIESIRATFDGLISQDDIRVWQAVGPLFWPDPANGWRRQAAELMREEFLASLQADIVHVGNLFDGVVDNMTCSIGKRIRIPTAVTFHDAIPLIQPNVYLKPNPTYESFYRARLEQLRRADLVLAVSESARREAIDYAGVSAERAISISSACDPMFAPAVVVESAKTALWHKLGLSGSGFVMYSGGADERKNHLRLIEAFAFLPQSLRAQHPLVFVGMMPADQGARFLAHARAHGLSEREFVLGGHVTDGELVGLYRLCTLFVFPSTHEGFGLPVLEAMSCGAPTICANSSSLPEVMGRADSMFDPCDVQGLARLINKLLIQPRQREELVRHGLTRSALFSWDRCAQTALAAFERLHRQDSWQDDPRPSLLEQLPSTIGSAASQRYSVPDQDLVALAAALSSNSRWSTPPTTACRQLLVDLSIMADNDGKSGVQRVVHGLLSSLIQSPPAGFRVEPVYSPPGAASFRYARSYMRRRYSQFVASGETDDVISLKPGDVFLGLDLHHSALYRPEFFGHLRQMGVRTVFLAHDLLPIHLPHCFAPGMDDFHTRWLQFICQTDGVVCVSRDVALDLVAWLNAHGIERQRPLSIGWSHNGCDAPGAWQSRSLSAQAERTLDQLQGRDVFLSVGTIEPRKGHRQLLAAFDLFWAGGADVSLVLVGREGWDVDELVGDIRRHPEFGGRLLWLEGIDDAFLERIYRASCCLVAPSLGEGFGLPLVEAGVRGLPILARDLPVFHEVAGSHATYFRGETPLELADAVGRWLAAHRQGAVPSSTGVQHLSWAQSSENLLKLALESQWPIRWRRQQTLFLDVSELARHDAKTGIQRVVRALARNLLLEPPAGMSVCLIWFDGQVYRHALRLQTRLCHGVHSMAGEPVVDFRAGDVYLALDPSPGWQPLMEPAQRDMRRRGVNVWVLVHDLLPLRHAEWWVSSVAKAFARWLDSVTEVASGFVCISETTAEDVRLYLAQSGFLGAENIPVRSFHIGADIEDSEPSRGLPPDAEQFLALLKQRPSFLMVGTLEPRKGHAQTIAAFERLWAQGHEINLVVVGKKGWLADDLFERLSRHPRLGREFHLLHGISDEYLDQIYAASACLLAASEGEGFGLPLIEAAVKHLPIIARDLPVFHEVAGNHAYYFEGLGDTDLAAAILDWLELSAQGRHPTTNDMPWLTWRESAQQLLRALWLSNADTAQNFSEDRIEAPA
ncbi:glycosyltransferase family 4 protein [Methylovirgula sp. 4M-Z18]|uniref:glycosyltransferase family 4 protein n=1 Tax=Methylovirgula sp. 4M-Z18 TaxID=2293567 RepID=UPI000E2FBC68|nr:glycosyltransferase family 1 protein [Methylovirgula sp. 4M-Z18]RFB78394.1 glycosyltransferase family 1 protein [Methylovirgula sp. 4M-Z18]